MKILFQNQMTVTDFVSNHCFYKLAFLVPMRKKIDMSAHVHTVPNFNRSCSYLCSFNIIFKTWGPESLQRHR